MNLIKDCNVLKKALENIIGQLNSSKDSELSEKDAANIIKLLYSSNIRTGGRRMCEQLFSEINNTIATLEAYKEVTIPFQIARLNFY